MEEIVRASKNNEIIFVIKLYSQLNTAYPNHRDNDRIELEMNRELIRNHYHKNNYNSIDYFYGLFFGTFYYNAKRLKE